jgi:hypothetical protein
MELTVVILTLILVYILFKTNSYYKEIDYISVGDSSFVVRDLPDKQQAAELLKEIDIRIVKLIDYMCSSGNELGYRLKRNYKSNSLSEGSLDHKYTTYTVNKGEQIVFCLRDRGSEKLHKLNMMMFVALHELSHIGSISEGHTQEFKTKFTELLGLASKIGIYTNEKFTSNPQTYCGTVINNDGGLV